MQKRFLTWGAIAGGMLAWVVAAGTVRAEEAPAAATAAEEKAPDPTRGHWDTFLDPLRDAEDAVAAWQDHVQKETNARVSFGVTKSWLWNFNDPRSGYNTLHSLDPEHYSPNLDLGQLSLVRPSQKDFPGYTFRIDFGKIPERIKADWNGNGMVGHGDTFENTSVEAQEAFLTYTLPEETGIFEGITLKGGKFVTLLGAEVIEPWANYHFSRSFLFGLAIPYTHTGALATIPFGSQLSVTVGGVSGWDNVDDNNDGPSGIGNVTWTATDWLTLAVNGIFGPEQTGKVSNKRSVIDLVATVKPTDRLTLLLNYDHGGEENVLAGPRRANWQGFAGVVNYNFTDRCSAALRGEWFEDSGGFRTGHDQHLWESTVDLKYLVTQHLYFRAEYRHDESDRAHVFEAGDGKATPGQDLAGFEVTYLFN